MYYPIVDGINVRSGRSTDYDFQRHYPIFKAVSIVDNGTTYDYSTKEKPDTITWVGQEISGNSVTGLATAYSLYNGNYLCRSTTKAGDTESGNTDIVEFSYKAVDGHTYRYYVGFRFYDEVESDGCFTPETLITLADGTQKEIQYLSADDMLLVWDFHNGEYTYAPSAIIFNHGTDDYRVLKLNFSDGTTVEVIQDHFFFDLDSNEFVTIGEYNVDKYVGHKFAKADNDFTAVTLVGYDVEEEYTTSYSVLSAVHYNCIAEGMLTLSPNPIGGNFFMPFEVGEDMKFDAEKMQADIEKYGLFTYEEFAELATAEQFYGLNGPQIKVAVGKGIITMEQLFQIIAAFLPNK